MILGVLIPTFIYTFLYCYGKKKRREMNREMGTQAPEEETPTCNGAANGYLPSEHYLAARRPSTDLVSIDEEDETGSTAMQESSSQSPPSHKTGIYVGSPHEHTVIDITTLRSGATEPDTTSAESETNHTQTAAETETRHCVAGRRRKTTRVPQTVRIPGCTSMQATGEGQEKAAPDQFPPTPWGQDEHHLLYFLGRP